MIDTMEEEEVVDDDHRYAEGNGDNNYDSDAIFDRGQSIPGNDYGNFYEQYLYSLLPAIYKEYDAKEENNVLREFLKIIASQAAALRQDIDGLLNNFFINSCDEWVVPYIADLIAAKVHPNSSLSSRLDVHNTIRWRKLKGTHMGLVDLIRNTVNGNAKVMEAFKHCSSFQRLAFEAADVVVNKPHNILNLHDQDALDNIDTENDIVPHTIDVREPTQTSGWYNIKNVLLFVPQLNIYHIRQVQAEKEENGLRYYFSNIVRKQKQPSSSSSPPPSSSSPSNHFPLYDLDEGVKIRGATFAQDPFKYFGRKRGMSIKIDNILAACPNPPTFSPVEPYVNPQENRVTIGAEANGSNHDDRYHEDGHDSGSGEGGGGSTDPDFVTVHKTEGIRILEPRNFSEPDKQFIIRLYCYSEEHRPVEVANYDTSKMSYQVFPTSELKKIGFGTILISIELVHSNLSASEFPKTVIAIRDSRKKNLVKDLEKDSIMSKYRNALYVYLPSALIKHDEKKYFFVDTHGSTFEVQMINDRYDIRNFKLSRSASSQIYPPREFTYSLQPLHRFVELNRFNGIKAIDAKKYGKESFLIEAVAINHDKKQAWKIGKLQIKADSLQYDNEKEVWIEWRIILGDSEEPQSKGERRGIYEEHLLPSCHFKATRLALKKNFEEYADKRIEEIVESLLPGEIMPENALGKKVGTYRIDQRKKSYNNNNTTTSDNNTYEYEVSIIIRPEYREQFEYLVNEIENSIENEPVFVNEGKLMLRISKTTRGDFPLSEIILTNSSGRSVLVYLPQLKFDNNDQKFNLYVTDDGSTSLEEHLLSPARKSAGQIIPIPDKYPLQQRIPVYMNLANWQSVNTSTVYSGELAIDPEHGRFAFSRNDHDNDLGEGDSASMHVTVDYNYAFSYDVGAGAYDRRAYLKKATKWVSKSGHTSHNDAFPSKTFHTIADALASAKDNDVIQVEDSAIYDSDDDGISNIMLPSGVRAVTLQAANWTMPVIKLTDNLNLTFSHYVKRINLNGMLITGGPFTLQGNFDRLALVSCTIDPRFLGISIEQQEYHSAATDRSKRQRSNTSLKEISLNRSISGGITVDNSVSIITVEDSIIDNPGGPAISYVNENNKRKNITLKLRARRSDILSKYKDPAYVLRLKDICCTDSILTNRVEVSVKDKQDRNGGDDNNSCTSITNSRYEQGSKFEKIRKDNDAIVDFAVGCTTDRPIFISTTFGDPAYLHLERLNSKSILEGAENTLEMGAFNQNDKPLRMRNLNLRLREFLPLGIKDGIVYIY